LVADFRPAVVVVAVVVDGVAVVVELVGVLI